MAIKTASKTLGILSICFGPLIPIVGIPLGIIGIIMQKEKGKENRDTRLNLIGLIISIVFCYLRSM